MNKRVVIIEDEFFVANHLKNILENAGYDVVGQFHDGEQAIKNIESLKNAVYLLDIQLSSHVNGIEIAGILQEQNIPFIYITANAEDGTFESAISTQPVSYISKPFKERDVIAGVALAFLQMKNTIAICTNSKKYVINLDDILYLKSDNVYVTIYTVSKSILLRKQLGEVAEDLTQNFKRCHRSYIVNADMVTKIENDSIFINDIEIPVSRRYKKDF